MDSAPVNYRASSRFGFCRKKPCAGGYYRIQQKRHSRMRRFLAQAILVFSGALAVYAQSDSPYATAADFANYARKLREQALLKVEPQVFVPTTSRPTTQLFPCNA